MIDDIELINPYHPNIQLKNFIDLDDKLNEWYDYIGDYNPDPPTGMNRSPRAIKDFRSTSRDIYYYIDLLYDNNPKSVIDFGCGECLFKRWFPNIFGVDPTPWPFGKADVTTPNITQFVKENKNKFDCGMALNSIHFGSFDEVRENINQCMTLIKSKGRFLFTVNIDSIIKFGKYDNSAEFVNTNSFYNEVIKKLEYNILLLDVLDRKKITYIPPLNGDIRFILEKD